MARPHGDGEVLRERPAADVDRLVRATVAAARVPRRRGADDAGVRAGAAVLRVLAASLARARVRAFSVSARHHRHRELRVSQLPRLAARLTIACDLPPPKTPRWRETARLERLRRLRARDDARLRRHRRGAAPARLLSPFRIGESYGLFAVMTRARYEIEFQGTLDGKTWVAYPFRYKPQDPYAAPGIYAPYQPRFDWDLWFASLDDSRSGPGWSPSRSGSWPASRRCCAVRARSVRRRKPIAVRAIAVALLVHHAGGEARDRRLVAARGDRRLLPRASRDMPAAMTETPTSSSRRRRSPPRWPRSARSAPQRRRGARPSRR